MTFDELCEAKPSDALAFALDAFLEKENLELNPDRKPLGRHFSASGNTVDNFGRIAINKCTGMVDAKKAIELNIQLHHLRRGNTTGYFFCRGWSRRTGFELTTKIAHFAFNPALFKENIESLISKLKENGY